MDILRGRLFRIGVQGWPIGGMQRHISIAQGCGKRNHGEIKMKDSERDRRLAIRFSVRECEFRI